MLFFKHNVLIFENNQESLDIMIGIFESKFLKVYGATNSCSAIEIFRNNKINAVICEINLSTLNAFDIINKIREINYLVPIIIISAYSNNDYLLKALNSNVQGFFKKPLISDNIEEIMNRIFYHQNQTIINRNIKLSHSTTLDLENSSVIVDDEIRKFTSKELEFIKLLFQKRGSIVSYKMIEDNVWSNEEDIMTSTSLRTLVKNVRKKISIDIIENISKIGYRLTIKD